ncbi:hypothetical protein CCMSSC00406_0009197 [Pleurotus cornucopiae]|uniref:Uncharacterized protein n=1 Tax=Pleurotus cornucopiae TaxID=5321 RepID=A0ACB7IWA6_PLECO|nr:hypothetical protein CCMSSC00406_0009197 [Pleurotus cornucopiae]
MTEYNDMSLTDFIARYTQIMAYDDYPDLDQALVNFALAGIDDTPESRFRINMVENYCLRANSGIPNITRDYDSFIGFTDRIPIKRDLYLYPLPPHHISTIAQSMHLKVPFHTSTGIQNLDPANVPNILLGKTTVKLTSEEAEMLYNEILQPTVATIAPALAKDWPTSLEAERFRAKTSRSAYQNTPYILNVDLIGQFKHELNRRLQAHTSFKNPVFCTHIQGIKGSTMHDMSALAADLALTKMLEDFDVSRGLWWVDVGIELQDGGRVILWRADAAPNLLSYVLGTTLDEAGRVVRSGQFQADINSHLLEVAGFRVGFPTPAGENRITYVQAYTTDKSLTYHKQGFQHSQNLMGLAAMKGHPPQYCTDLIAAYTDARQKNVAARLEVRLPLQFAPDFMLEFDNDVLRPSIISLHRENFWNWRIVRMDAFSRLLSVMNDQSAEQIVTPPVLSTYAAVVWMVNGIHSRPNPQSLGQECRKVALPYFEDHYASDLLAAGFNEAELNTLAEENVNRPFSPYNVLFMRRILFPPATNTVRLPMDRLLLKKYHIHMFGKSLPDLRLQFKATGVIRHRDLHARRLPMNKGLSRARIGPTPPTAFFVGLTEIQEEPVLDVGPNVPVLQQIFDDEDESERTVQQRVADIWAQFPCCILQKVGNPKWRGALPSYCRIPQHARQSVTIDIMKDTNLAKVFARAQVSHVTIPRWRKAFEACFPPKGHITPKSVQAWTHMRYYMDWKALMGSLNANDADKVREALWEEFKNLAWLPAATSEQPWRTDRAPSCIQLPPLEEISPFAEPNIPGPQIIWSPFQDPNIFWDPSVPLAIAPPAGGALRVNGVVPALPVAEEEEESSGDEAEAGSFYGLPGGPQGGRENRQENTPEAREPMIRALNRPSPQRQQSRVSDFALPDVYVHSRNGMPAAMEVSRASGSSSTRDRASVGPKRSLLAGTPQLLGRRSRREEEEEEEEEESQMDGSVEPEPKRARIDQDDDSDDSDIERKMKTKTKDEDKEDEDEEEEEEEDKEDEDEEEEEVV